jgi:tetratricopeptide (TPR) repeat protein
VIKFPASYFLQNRSIFVCVAALLVFICSTQAHAIDSRARLDAEQMRSEKEKIEKSIQLTAKIKSPEDAQFLPDLYMTLAELYIDKARIGVLAKTYKVAATKLENVDLTAEKRLKRDAIDIFQQIENRFPDYKRMDRALFFQAHEYRELKEYKEAFEVYKRLNDKFLESPYWEESKLLSGNIFFDRRDFDQAVVHYNELLKRKSTYFHNIAHLKIGWCNIHRAKWLDAANEFHTAMKISVDVSSPAFVSEEFEKNDVREEALVASVWPLSELSADDLRQHPEYLDLVLFFQTEAYDQPSYRKVMARLGKRLVLKKRWREAALSFYEAFRVSGDTPSRLASLEDYYSAMKESGTSFFPAGLATELRLILERMAGESRAVEVVIAKSKKKPMREDIISKFETVIRDIGTTLHKNAVASKRQDDIDQGIKAYQDYVYLYPKGKFSFDMNVNLAELLYLGGRKIEAGTLYFELASLDKAKRKDLMDSSVRSLIEAMQKANELTLYERVRGRVALRDVGAKYIKEFPRSQAEPTLVFNMARTHYEERNFKLARTQLRSFVEKYRRSKDQEAATLLLLDTYYQLDDLKGMNAEGTSILRKGILSPEATQRVTAVLKDAQLKRVRTLAGDFGSKAYADKFLQLAKAQKGSSLGQTALLEAFTSMKATANPKIFDIGEQYLVTYTQTKEAKNVLATLIQLSLALVDGPRAANYLEAYADRFTDDINSQNYRNQALAIYESLGMTADAVQIAKKQNNLRAVLRLLRSAKSWSELAKEASKQPDTFGIYHHGLASLRLGDLKQAMPLFERLQATGSKAVGEEKDQVGHASFMLALESERVFVGFSKGEVMNPKVLQQKVALFQESERRLQSVISLGAGSWTVAALVELARMNASFARYLQNAPLPPELPREKFNLMVAGQMKLYGDTADQSLNQCVKTVNENTILSRFTLACVSRGRVAVSEVDEYELLPRGRSTSDLSEAVKSKLIKDPKDTKTLTEHAQIYFRAAEYGKSALFFQRLMELEPQVADHSVGYAGASMATGSLGTAFDMLKRTLKDHPEHREAQLLTAAIYKRYGLVSLCQASLSRANSAAASVYKDHPWVRELGVSCAI